MHRHRQEGRQTQRIDWNRLWQEQYANMPKEDDKEFWNDFAPRFRKKLDVEEDPYIGKFYEYSEFRPGETIFDMGCASGTLAIPFAKQGHEIWAADFSEEMLKYLMINAKEEGVADRIHPIRLDWNEDWSARTDLPLCDVAISSRSFIVWDLSQGIRNLESVARRKVCVGAWDVPAHGYDRIVAEAIGYERPGYGCYFYILNELIDRDLLPQLQFIKSPFRLSKYESKEQALESQIKAFQFGLTDEQVAVFYIDSLDHPDRYSGKTVRFVYIFTLDNFNFLRRVDNFFYARFRLRELDFNIAKLGRIACLDML